MYNDKAIDNNSFEKYPGEKLNSEPSEANLAQAEKWQSAMDAEDTPPFAGDMPMTQESIEELSNPEVQDNNGLTDAAAIVNYGLNAAAREYGVETVVQKIKNFDASSSDNPIRDLFVQLGVDTPMELEDVRLEKEAARPQEADFYENSEVAPTTKNRTPEGAFKAIEDMKELISEVEGADPRYEQLRREARAAGKGYFEYAVGSNVDRGLTDLFNALAAQPKVEEEKSGLEPESENSASGEQAPENPEAPVTLNPGILSPQERPDPSEIKL